MSQKRKSTSKAINKEQKSNPPLIVTHLAEMHGIDPQQLLNWNVYECGKVALVTLNGMKFIFEGIDLSQIFEANHDSQP